MSYLLYLLPILCTVTDFLENFSMLSTTPDNTESIVGQVKEYETCKYFPERDLF